MRGARQVAYNGRYMLPTRESIRPSRRSFPVVRGVGHPARRMRDGRSPSMARARRYTAVTSNAMISPPSHMNEGRPRATAT